MQDAFKAFIDFLTDLFAALAEFLGGTLPFGDILGSLNGALEGESTTTPEA